MKLSDGDINIEEMTPAQGLEAAQKAYDEGKWQKAIDIAERIIESVSRNDADEPLADDVFAALRIIAWSRYYLAIKGSPDEKTANLEYAHNAFKALLRENYIPDAEEVSAYNGFPLVLWLLGNKDDALAISNKAIAKFPDTPSIWNTRGILCRWAEDYEEAVRTGERVFETASKRKEYLMAGHGKHNKGDALVKLGRKEEAKKEYAKALELYRQHQDVTNKKATVHIDGVTKKLADLQVAG